MKYAIDKTSREIVSADHTREGDLICPTCGTYVYWKSAPGGSGRGYFTHGRLVATNCHHKDNDLLQAIAEQTDSSVVQNLSGYRRHMQRRRRQMEEIQEELRIFDELVVGEPA